MASGSSMRRRRSSGCSARWVNMQSSDAVTVSRPAMRNRKQMSRISSWESRSPSTSASRNALSRSSDRSVAPLGDHPLEVGVDRVGGRAAGEPRCRGGPTAARPPGPAGSTPSFIARKVPRSSIGSPNMLRNTCDGNGVENRWTKSISGSSMKPSISSFDQRTDLVLPLAHPLRREQRVEDLAVLPVIRRVDLERDERTGGLHVVGGGARREHLRLAQHLLDPGPGGDDHAHAVEPEHRRPLVQHRVDRLRAARHLRVHQLGETGAVLLSAFDHVSALPWSWRARC